MLKGGASGEDGAERRRRDHGEKMTASCVCREPRKCQALCWFIPCFAVLCSPGSPAQWGPDQEVR